ncbi:MAG TPA: YeeE/YedE thiosulfate transporter family protein [Polyangiales bacterium]
MRREEEMTQAFFAAAAGGLLFGAAAGLLMLGTGRIAGIAGIAGGLVHPERGELLWRALFVAGMLLGGLLGAQLLPASFVAHAGLSAARLLGAGVLIGVGARLANGCTSGHGICGVGRLSLRSVVAVAIFSTTGALTHLLDRWSTGGAP